MLYSPAMRVCGWAIAPEATSIDNVLVSGLPLEDEGLAIFRDVDGLGLHTGRALRFLFRCMLARWVKRKRTIFEMLIRRAIGVRRVTE